MFLCPFCKHHKPKFSINLERGAKCWICNWATPKLSRIVYRLGTHQQREQWQEMEGSVDLSEFSLDLFENKKEVVEEVTIPLPDEFVALANKTLPRSAMFPLKYLKGRGIKKEDILYWKMGYCSTGDYADRILVPSFNLEGGVNFFVARTYTGDWPKYKNPPTHRDIVFNELWINWDEPIILVEGVFDAIKSGPNSIPLLGSSLRENSRLFQAIVKYNPRVYLALDKDAASKTGYIAKRFMEYDVELYKIDLKDYNDVGEMTHEEFSANKQDAISINFENYLLQETLAI